MPCFSAVAPRLFVFQDLSQFSNYNYPEKLPLSHLPISSSRSNPAYSYTNRGSISIPIAAVSSNRLLYGTSLILNHYFSTLPYSDTLSLRLPARCRIEAYTFGGLSTQRFRNDFQSEVLE